MEHWHTHVYVFCLVCVAVCESGCKHGECVGPDQCRCHAGYTGKTCNQGINVCVCVNVKEEWNNLTVKPSNRKRVFSHQKTSSVLCDFIMSAHVCVNILRLCYHSGFVLVSEDLFVTAVLWPVSALNTDYKISSCHLINSVTSPDTFS